MIESGPMPVLKRLQAFFDRWRLPPPPVRSIQHDETQPPLVFPGSGGAPFPALASLIRHYDGSGNGPRILVFGDSVMQRVSRSDTDQRNLGEMIAAALGGEPLALSYSAFHPGIYRHLSRVVAQLPNRPELVILPVNLRCFSPQWDRHPAWQFEKQIATIEEWLSTPDRPIPPIEDIRETPGFFDAYDAVEVDCALSDLRTIGAFRALVRSRPAIEDETAHRAREIFIFHYGHRLIPEHRRLRSLQEAIGCFNAAGCRVFVYATPINIDACERLAGPELRSTLRRNIAVLRSAIGDTAYFQDWSEAFPGDAFFHEDLATEHLNQTGRTDLAVRIARQVQADRMID